MAVRCFKLTLSHIMCQDLESGMTQEVEDLELDVPHALDLLTLFVARAVTDDILPPSFVTHTKGTRDLPYNQETELPDAPEMHFA